MTATARLRARLAAWALAALAVPAVACGGEAGDLLALEVSGGPSDEPVRLTVTEDGRGRCGGGALESIPSERLIEAREVERELEGLAADGAAFTPEADRSRDGERPADGRRRYVARTQAGTVRWVEGLPGLPDVLPRAALLTQALEEALCEP